MLKLDKLEQHICHSCLIIVATNSSDVIVIMISFMICGTHIKLYISCTVFDFLLVKTVHIDVRFYHMLTSVYLRNVFWKSYKKYWTNIFVQYFIIKFKIIQEKMTCHIADVRDDFLQKRVITIFIFWDIFCLILLSFSSILFHCHGTLGLFLGSFVYFIGWNQLQDLNGTTCRCTFVLLIDYWYVLFS